VEVGIDYPWLNYDWDFGNPPHGSGGEPWGRRAEWKDRLAADLKRFREIGIFAVRWWILGSGLAYGVGTDAPVRTGGKWTVPTVPQLSDAVLNDFRDALSYFRDANVRVLPVFADFRMFLDGETQSLAPGYVKGGRYELVSDSVKRRQFLERALLPLLRTTKPFTDVIYGFELMNEPEWCVRDPGQGIQRGRSPTVDRSAMLGFLREGVAMINAAGLRSSIGFRNRTTIDAWASIQLRVQLHQFHYYPERLHWYTREPAVPTQNFSQEWPIFVGEFASAIHLPWPELSDVENRDPDNYVYHRLRLLASKGYPSAFIWSAEEHPQPPPENQPQPVAWNASVQAQIHRFAMDR
jgi:hypothetical protein